MMIDDKYEVLEIIGEGGNGVVYKVKEKSTNRILAVKEMRIGSEKAERDAKREAIILQTCFHPSLPVVLENFTKGEWNYMVMEYVEGVTLKEYMSKHKKLPKEKVLHFAKKIGEVLLYLHNRQPSVIYGDLKPQNIIVTPEEEIRLIDFGTAGGDKKDSFLGEKKRHAESEERGCYASVGYAAPEQLRGCVADSRSDIYSFGALLHYLLTGEDPQRPPYVRRDLRECDSAIPIGICWAVSKCLKEIPEERYQSMERVLYDLQNFTKKERGKRLFHQVNQTVQIFLFLICTSCFYKTFEKWKWGMTWRENEFLAQTVVFFVLGCIWRGVMLSGSVGKKYGYQMEKNIWKTDKKGVGLLAVLVVLGLWGLRIGVSAKEPDIPLPVTLYNEAGYKILWRENQVIPLEGNFRLEIPKECFKGESEYEITVTLSEKATGKILFRQFDVKTVKSSIEN